MSEEPEEHHGLLDDDPALDFILYNEMVKDEKRPPKGKGGCLSLVLFMIVPMAGTLLLILFYLSLPSLSNAADKPDHYCDDQASWQQWEKLLSDNPGDDGIASLYAFRVGLCSMVKSGQIEIDRATKLFEGFRDTVIQGAEESQRQSLRDEGI